MSVPSLNPAAAAIDLRPQTPSFPGGEIRSKFTSFINQLEQKEKFVDRVISQAMRGKDFSPGELIAIQAGVYRYTHQMEAFSKLVDRAAGAVRRTIEAGG